MKWRHCIASLEILNQICQLACIDIGGHRYPCSTLNASNTNINQNQNISAYNIQIQIQEWNKIGQLAWIDTGGRDTLVLDIGSLEVFGILLHLSVFIHGYNGVYTDTLQWIQWRIVSICPCIPVSRSLLVASVELMR